MNIDTSTSSTPVAAPPNTSADVAKAASTAVTAAVKQPAPAPQQTVQATVDAIRAAAKQIDTFLKSVGRSLDIRVDDATGRMVVTVRDADSGDVIRQIPSEEALKLARSLGESSAAILDLTA